LQFFYNYINYKNIVSNKFQIRISKMVENITKENNVKPVNSKPYKVLIISFIVNLFGEYSFF